MDQNIPYKPFSMDELREQFITKCAEIGLFGRTLLQEFEKTGCGIVFVAKDDLEDDFLGEHASYDDQFNFINMITIVEEGLDDQSLFQLIVHEMIHAIQANRCAGYLAAQGAVTITPYAALEMMFATELDASTKERFFDFLCYNLEDQSYSLSSYDDRSFVKTMIEKFGKDYLFSSAEVEVGSKEVRDTYINHILSYYEDNIETFKSMMDQDSFVFVEFDDYDLWEVGETLGFNSLALDSTKINFQNRVVMNDSQWARLEALHTEFDIGKGQEVITFATWLEEYGMSRQNFIDYAKNIPNA